MTVVPLSEFGRRMPEAGRIRFGIKGPKGQPMAIKTFRFTAESRGILENLANLHGGEVRDWTPGRGRNEFEVVTEASEIDVVIPPNALGGTPVYELWSGGGIQRRCDGVLLQIPTRTPDGAIMQEQPCICDRKGAMECSPVTRLNVLIPGVPFTGTWRLEAKGWNAAHELPGMVDMIVALHDRGLTKATLALESRTSTSDGKTRHFVVPVLRVPATLEELAAGQAVLQGLAPGGTASTPAIAAPTDPDDQVAEAEVLEDEPDQLALLRSEFVGLTGQALLSTPEVAAILFTATGGRVEHYRDLSLTQLTKINEVLISIIDGSVEFDGVDGRRAVLRKKKTA